MRARIVCAVLVLAVMVPAVSWAEELSPAAMAGWNNIQNKCYLPTDFDDAVFENLWTVWPEQEREQARGMAPAERRKAIFAYYGLVPRPEDPECQQMALGYTRKGTSGWVMNCMACHGGSIVGQTIPGLGNSHFAMQTLTEDVSRVKLKQFKPLSHLDLAALRMPLAMTDGTTNAVVFGILLGAIRNPDMTVDLTQRPPPVKHHDVDAPPFWNVKAKTSLYADGFSPKTGRPLMQFLLVPSNNRDRILSWEQDFDEVLAWIESVEPPAYPFAIDQQLADAGEIVFRNHCARCHGTYGPSGHYEQQTIAIDEIGTDRMRFDALTPEHRAWMQRGWMSRFGEDPVVVDPTGYVAPPLRGIWASGPYFHNGSVPTLWHVLHPGERPKVWKRTRDGYDPERVGLEIVTSETVPEGISPAERRRYFQVDLPGKSAAGHLYPNDLTEVEKRQLLEYLKRL